MGIKILCNFAFHITFFIGCQGQKWCLHIYRGKTRQKYLLRQLLFAVLSAYLATHWSSAVELMVFISLGFRLWVLAIISLCLRISPLCFYIFYCWCLPPVCILNAFWSHAEGMTHSPFPDLMKINPVFCNAPFPLPERNLGWLADLTSNLLITHYWLKVESLICVFKKPPERSCGWASLCITNMQRTWCVCVLGAVICIWWLCIWQLDWRTPLVSSHTDGSCAVWQLGKL